MERSPALPFRLSSASSQSASPSLTCHRTKNGANGEGGSHPNHYPLFFATSTGRSGAPPARMLFHPASIFPSLLRRHSISWSAVFCSTPSLKPSCPWHPPTKTHAYVLILRASSMPARQRGRSIWWRHHKTGLRMGVGLYAVFRQKESWNHRTSTPCIQQNPEAVTCNGSTYASKLS